MRRIINHEVFDTSTALAVGGYKFQNTKYTFYRRKSDGRLFCHQEELICGNKVWTSQIIVAGTSAALNFVIKDSMSHN